MRRHRMTGSPSCGTLKKGGDGDVRKGQLSSLRAFTLEDHPFLRGSWQCDGGCILEAVFSTNQVRHLSSSSTFPHLFSQ